MRVRATLAIAALSLGLAAAGTPAMAQSYGGQPSYGQNTIHQDAYCAKVRQNRMMVGGAIGAAVGAVLGNNLAARNAQTEGSALGGVAGAATGAIIGRNTGQCSPASQNRARAAAGYPQGGYQQGGYEQPYPEQGYGRPASGERYPLEGGPDYRNAGYGSGGDPNCRWGTVSTRDPDGREVRDSIYMCRGPDGVWRAKQPY